MVVSDKNPINLCVALVHLGLYRDETWLFVGCSVRGKVLMTVVNPDNPLSSCVLESDAVHTTQHGTRCASCVVHKQAVNREQGEPSIVVRVLPEQRAEVVGYVVEKRTVLIKILAPMWCAYGQYHLKMRMRYEASRLS